MLPMCFSTALADSTSRRAMAVLEHLPQPCLDGDAHPGHQRQGRQQQAEREPEGDMQARRPQPQLQCCSG